MSFAEFSAGYRRRDILTFLKDCGGRLGDEVLRVAVENLGHPRLSRELLRRDINFLKERGLVNEEWSGDILIAIITRRGVEAAEGRITVEGVEKPPVGV